MAQILSSESKSSRTWIFLFIHLTNADGCRYLSYVPGTVHGTELSASDSEMKGIFPVLKDLSSWDREIRSSTNDFFFKNPLLKCKYIWKDNNLSPSHPQALGGGEM